MMRVSIKSFVLGLAVVGLSQSARADNLIVGTTNQSSYKVVVHITSAQGNANTPGGQVSSAMGGNFAGASLNAPGTFVGKLPFLYCVDLFHHLTLGDGVGGLEAPIINPLPPHNTIFNPNGYYSTNAPSGTNPPNPNPLVNSTNNAEPTAGYITNFSKVIGGVLTDQLGVANEKGIAQLVALGDQKGTGDILFAKEAALQVAIWTAEYNKPVTTGPTAGLGWSATGNANFQFSQFVNAAHNIDTNVASANTTAFNNALKFDMSLISGANFTALLAASIHKNVLFTNPDVYNPGQPNAYAQAGVSYVPAPGSLAMSIILFGMFGIAWSYKRLNAVKVTA
jgi:hypothetical protein